MVEVTITTEARTLTQEEQDSTVAEAKAAKHRELNDHCDSLCASCSHLSLTWQADRVSSGSIIAKHHVLEGAPPANTTWIDASNTQQTLTWANFESLKDRIFAFYEDVLTNKTTHKKAIDALSDVATINAYNVTTGWPS